ncbi:MAG TPA: hypothetical protein VGN17_11670 [Bryobacteraceae bacterium]|jgi:hypothetical protein
MKYSAAMFILLAAPLVSAPHPTLLREIDLTQIVPLLPGFTPRAALAFSPDENWLAIVVSTHQTDPRKRNGNLDHSGSEAMLLLPLHGPPDQKIQIDPGLRPEGAPGWSPGSDAVYVQGFAHNLQNPSKDGKAALWDLQGKQLWRRDGPGLSADGPPGGIAGFLDAQHLLARGVPSKGATSEFEVLNLQGQVVDMWAAPKHAKVADISPERGLVAVLSQAASKTLIVDAKSKKTILSKDNPYSYLGEDGGSWQYFTESGKTLCSVGSVGRGRPQRDTSTECWDVDTGKKIARFERFPGGAPAAASAHGSRLVLTRDLAFPLRGEALVFPAGERVVWDFRSGAEVASWESPQVVWTNGAHIFDAVALSSTGRYVAETTGNLLRIYQLP